MVVWYVQTWMISKGKTKEHDEVVKKIFKHLRTWWKSPLWYFSQRNGPIGARVSIGEYENQTEYQDFLNKFNKDEEALKLRAEWLNYIDPNTWKAIFWNKKVME